MSHTSAFRSHLDKFRYYYVALLVILIDQGVKFAVKFNMLENQSIQLAGDTLKIHYIENNGAAFGLTVGDIFASIGIVLAPVTAKLILTLFSLMAVIVIVYFLRRTSRHRSPLPFFVALILGGALGNIIDRVFYGVWFQGVNGYEGGLLEGQVVDMFFLDLGTRDILGMQVELWPVFNVADASICVGIVTILLMQGVFFRIHRKNVIRLGLDPEQDPVLMRHEGKKKVTSGTAPE